MRLKMGLLSGLMLSMLMIGACGSYADDVTDPPPTVEKKCDEPAMMQSNIILVPIAEVKEWDNKLGGGVGLCIPPNEVATLFQDFCTYKGYYEMRYGQSDGTCKGGIVQDFDLYKNVICFSPILNQ